MVQPITVEKGNVQTNAQKAAAKKKKHSMMGLNFIQQQVEAEKGKLAEESDQNHVSLL